MKTIFPKGTRVRVVRQWTEYGYTTEPGAIGTVTGGLGRVLVTLDGFEDGKRRDKEKRERYGEGDNIMPWCIAVPPDYVEVIEQ